MLFQFLHLHDILEGLYFHCSLSVCVSVCVCVCPAILVNKIPAERMHRYCTGSDSIEIGDLGSKVKVTVTQYPFFFIILYQQIPMYISALVCLIILKFGMPLKYALCISLIEFHKNQMGA